MGSFLRAQDWWSYKVPPLLTLAYLMFGLYQVPLTTGVMTLAIFMISVVATAGFGHLLNDFTDIAEDARAGKSNVMARLSLGRRILVLLGLLVPSLLPWVWLPNNGVNFGLLLGLIAIFVLYSVPPVRLKERGFWGVLADGLYGHGLPNLITGITFGLFAPRWDRWLLAFLAALFAWKLMQGLCGATVSQILDRRNDRRSGARTFAITFGPRRALNLVNRLLLPLQLVFFLIVCGLISVHLPWFLTLYLGFVAFTAWKVHRRWHKPWTVYSRSYMGYAYINDFAELWMPLAILVYLVFSMPTYAVVLVAHIVLFTRLPALLARQLRRADRSAREAQG